MSVFRPGLFEGKSALVTGGGTGIGRAIASELCSLGASVVIAGRRPEPLRRTAAALPNCTWCAVDIRADEWVQALYDELPALDFLVNNAGGQFFSPAERITSNGFAAVIETNLTGTFRMCREAYNRFMRERGGAIVNIVAEMWRGFPGMAHTGAARAGVVNLTQTLAVEWAASGVRVNAVAPGIIDSEGLTTYPPEMRPVLDRAVRDTPAQRMGTEAEVSSAVVYLLSPAAAYISGETLKVDGAGSLWRKTWDIPAHERWERYEG